MSQHLGVGCIPIQIRDSPPREFLDLFRIRVDDQARDGNLPQYIDDMMIWVAVNR